MAVRLLIELSGEHPTLPRAEAYAALEAEGVAIRSVAFGSGVLRLEVDGPSERAARRLGLAHAVSEELAWGDWESIREFAKGADLRGQRFRVRARGVGGDVDAGALERDLGAALGRTGRVDLVHPDVDYRLLVGDEFIFGRILYRVDRSRLEATKVAHRPFSLPISLHPKYARALVNLSRVPLGGAVLDPFCGTGGVLLEAIEMGLRGIGTDRSRAMVEGARRSLRKVRRGADVAVADAGRPPVRRGGVDGIATDPPYGRAASTRGEPIERLYARAFDAFLNVLPVGAYAAVVVPTNEAIDIGSDRMELVERHDLRVHRSLVRHFCAFVRQ